MRAVHQYASLNVQKQKGIVVAGFKRRIFVCDEDVGVFRKDLDDMHRLHKALPIAVDFAGLDFIHPDCFLHLYVLHQTLAKEGLVLTLCRMPPHIHETCHVMGLGTLFTLCDDLASSQIAAKVA